MLNVDYLMIRRKIFSAEGYLYFLHINNNNLKEFNLGVKTITVCSDRSYKFLFDQIISDVDFTNVKPNISLYEILNRSQTIEFIQRISGNIEPSVMEQINLVILNMFM